MSVMVSTFQTIELPGDGARLAEVSEDGEVTIYPEGMGRGPQITMSMADWERISREVMIASWRHPQEGAATQD